MQCRAVGAAEPTNTQQLPRTAQRQQADLAGHLIAYCESKLGRRQLGRAGCRSLGLHAVGAVVVEYWQLCATQGKRRDDQYHCFIACTGIDTDGRGVARDECCSVDLCAVDAAVAVHQQLRTALRMRRVNLVRCCIVRYELKDDVRRVASTGCCSMVFHRSR